MAEWLIREVRHFRADGYLVALPVRLKDCLEAMAAQIPLVLVEVNFGRRDLPAVLINHHEGGLLAGRYLAEQGCRRTAFVSGPRGEQTIRMADAVLSGLTEVLGERAPVPSKTHVVTDRSEEQGREAVARLLRLPNPPDAIIVAGNDTTRGALAALRDSGLDDRKAPELIPYVDTPELSSCTVVMNPANELLGAEAARMLGKLMSGEKLEESVKWFSPKLIVR